VQGVLPGCAGPECLSDSQGRTQYRVLRLRKNFAARSPSGAQDDRVYGATEGSEVGLGLAAVILREVGVRERTPTQSKDPMQWKISNGLVEFSAVKTPVGVILSAFIFGVLRLRKNFAARSLPALRMTELVGATERFEVVTSIRSNPYGRTVAASNLSDIFFPNLGIGCPTCHSRSWSDRVGLQFSMHVKRRGISTRSVLHFITFSCYQRRKLLNSATARDVFEYELERVSLMSRWTCTGYVSA